MIAKSRKAAHRRWKPKHQKFKVILDEFETGLGGIHETLFQK